MALFDVDYILKLFWAVLLFHIIIPRHIMHIITQKLTGKIEFISVRSFQVSSEAMNIEDYAFVNCF